MIVYVFWRIVLAVPVILTVVTLTFLVTVTAPGDPLATLLPLGATPEQYAQAAREYGVDRPLPEQWLRYMERTVTGNLGRSLRTGNAVGDDLKQGFTATFELALLAFLLTAIIGVTVGVIAATQAGRPIDLILSIVSVGGIGAPIFWTALMLQLLLYANLRWLPAGGQIDYSVIAAHPVARTTGFYLVDTLLAGNVAGFGNALWHMLLPAAVLAYRALGTVVRVTRVAVIEALGAQYTQTARAFGARPLRIILGHVLPNAMLPILSVLGLSVGELLGGSVLVETIFSWPGLGRYTASSILNLDYPGVIGASLVITIIYVVANLVVDLLYQVFDPRLRTP